MESSLKELAGYRMERAKEMLSAAEDNLKISQYKTSLNRSYYAIFHAMRAMNIWKGFSGSSRKVFNRKGIEETKIKRWM